MLARRFNYILLAHLCIATSSFAGTVRIGVLGLFHPTELAVRPASQSVLVLEVAGRRIAVREGSEARLRAVDGQVECTIVESALTGPSVRIEIQPGVPAAFTLSVPDRISREYQGSLEVSVRDGVLVPVVAMDVELAVASAVAAESPPGAALEALKAQAVVTRSYYLAARRHSGFDFCDTTHCQFLRQAPGASSPAMIAATSTRGVVLTFRGEIVPALFSASCGGRTRSLHDTGMDAQCYPYYSVGCEYCLRHAARWKKTLSLENDADLRSSPGTEAWRLHIDRKLGWSAIPGNNYRLDVEGDSLIIQGSGQGHGVGLCQLGAAGLAAEGKSFQDILNYYFPNTSLADAIDAMSTR